MKLMKNPQVAYEIGAGDFTQVPGLEDNFTVVEIMAPQHRFLLMEMFPEQGISHRLVMAPMGVTKDTVFPFHPFEFSSFKAAVRMAKKLSDRTGVTTEPAKVVQRAAHVGKAGRRSGKRSA